MADKTGTTLPRMGTAEWKREKLYELKMRIIGGRDSRYDTQFIQLIDIIMEPEHAN